MICTGRNTFALDTILPAGLFQVFLVLSSGGVLILPGSVYRTNSGDSFRLEYAQAPRRPTLVPAESFFRLGEYFVSLGRGFQEPQQVGLITLDLLNISLEVRVFMMVREPLRGRTGSR